jgi:Mrp family chromosome partitioning ATPase
MALTDPVILSRTVDEVVVVAAGSQTPTQLVSTACARLNYARAKIVSVVLNKVDTRRSKYGYYYQAYSHYTNGPAPDFSTVDTAPPGETGLDK